MQLVIDIPDNLYEAINNDKYDVHKGKIYDIIRNGTPLPKGHGVLKDVDKIEWYGCTTASDCRHTNLDCKDCTWAECSKTQVDDIPTIIAADKENTE